MNLEQVFRTDKEGRMRKYYLTFIAFNFLIAAACQSRRETDERRFELKGKVVSVDKEHREVTIAHEEIPDFMSAMTMPFHVKENWALQVLAPGQEVRATLVISSGLSWIENIVITQAAGGGDPAAGAANAAEPQPGAEIPDFVLTDQDGRQIHLHQYRGKALLLTFIYTRCPLPDYCIRMSSNFSKILQAIEADSSLRGRVNLLSISFDPEFDKPAVLREYAQVYLENRFPDGLRLWQFASGTAETIAAITHFFGLQYSKESGQITHSLRTALIGPDGKLVHLYSGNEWTPSQIVADLKRLDRP